MPFIFNDNFNNISEYLKQSDELVIISKCKYGCYSNEVKRVLERCIGYVLPHFTIRNNQIHHKSRYDKKLKLSTYFYGNIDEKEEERLHADVILPASEQCENIKTVASKVGVTVVCDEEA